MASEHLDTYLQDHFAGATGGAELSKRIARSNPGNRDLDAVAAEVEEDRETLAAIMEALDISMPALKSAIAWAGEKAGRLKLNDRLFGRSPLSSVLELEGMIAGVTGKLELWRAMQEAGPGDRRVASFDFEALATRAESQRARLEAAHADAVRAGLGRTP